MKMRGALLVALATALLDLATSFYIPGAYPAEFRLGDPIQAKVNSLTSFETEMPFEYYTLPFCKPPEGIQRVANTANPGTLLEGLRIENSPYNFSVKVKQTAQVVCKPEGYAKKLTKEDVENLKHKIDNKYRINMLLDNLPVTTYDLLDENEEYVRPGFELGYKDDNGKYYINNHLVFNILVYLTHGEYTAAMEGLDDDALLNVVDARRQLRSTSASASGKGHADRVVQNARKLMSGRRLLQEDPTGTDALDENGGVGNPKEAFYMIVGFEVAPCSILRQAGASIDDVTCGMDNDAYVIPQAIEEGVELVYTYDVYWQDSDIKWASRWDAYLRMPGGTVHWFSIVNSVLVVLVMASMVAMILIRTVRRDLAKYEALMVDSSMDMKDEAGWKQVKADVFRPPPFSRALSVQVGTGVQIMGTSIVTLLLATLGFLNPSSRGGLITTTVVLYVWLAVLAGFSTVYCWGVLERTFNGWPMACAQASVLYPSIVIFIFAVLNIAIHHTGSTGAIPIGMFFGVGAVWFLISIPLTFVGGYMALMVPIIQQPVKTNQVPRLIPPTPPSAHPVLLFVAAGILPFGTIFIELYFAMTSLWLGFFYYLFGFVFLIGLLSVVVNAEIAILCTYVQLCAEDYRWWWMSFYRGGSVAMYIALYAMGFLVTSLSTLAGGLPVFIYICYMSIFIIGAYLAMGTVGFLSSYAFVHLIYAAVKAD